jgi:hypothetical protein
MLRKTFANLRAHMVCSKSGENSSKKKKSGENYEYWNSSLVQPLGNNE